MHPTCPQRIVYPSSENAESCKKNCCKKENTILLPIKISVQFIVSMLNNNIDRFYEQNPWKRQKWRNLT